MAKSAAITICDDGYVKGALALVNSLAKSSFSGSFYLFTTSVSVKDFFDDIFSSHAHLLPFAECVVCLRSRGVHPMYLKPAFILEVADDFDRLYFFDPDIVIAKKWGNFEFWSRSGVSLVIDSVWHPMHRYHVKRQAWGLLCKSIGIYQPLDFYVNSGYIGISKKDCRLLSIWIEVIDVFGINNIRRVEAELGVELFDCFDGTDQDSFNAALGLSDVPITLLGPAEGMGFGSLQNPYMLHAAGMRKPWRGSGLWDGLRHGRRPAVIYRRFLDYVREPIPVYPLWREWLGRVDYWGARAVTSVIRR